MGIAGQLVDWATDHFGPFAGATANPMSQSLFRKLGWQYVATNLRYARMLAPVSLLSERIARWAKRGHGSRYHMMSIPEPSAACLSNGDIGLRVLDRFDEAADALRQEVSEQVAVLGRTSTQLNWRYVDRPGHDYRIVAAYQSDRLRGWAVLAATTDGRYSRGSIPNSLWFPEDTETADAILCASVNMLAQTRASVINYVTLPRALSETLIRNRFKEREQEAELLVTSDVLEFARDDSCLVQGHWEVSL